MSIATTCPSCEAFFRLSDTLAGKRVQCQKCMARFIVPSAGSKETQPGIPVESIATSAPAKAPTEAPKPAKRKPVPAPADPDEPAEMDVEEVEDRPSRKRKADSEDEERPRRKRREDPDDDDEAEDRPRRKRRDDSDDDEDRPRRKRRDEDDDEEDEDDRPRRRVKKRKQSSGGSNMPMILAGVGVVVVLLLFCGGAGLFMMIGNRNADGGAGVAVAFGPDGVFRSEGALRLWDPTKDRRHFRLYTMVVEPGKTYEIDMTSRNLDAYLVLLDETNRVLMEDDDSGGNLNARIIYRADRAATFRIEASTFDDHETGNFTLTVRRR